MRYYGWETAKDYCYKHLDYFRHRPTHKWFSRYQHKAARKQAKTEMHHAQTTQTQET
jgi:hypothetical protein